MIGSTAFTAPLTPRSGAPRAASGPRATNWRVEATPATAADPIEAEWRALLDRAVDASPFMAPDFLLPAAIHQAGEAAPELAAVWREADGRRDLVALFALQGRGAGGVEMRSGPVALWRHPLQPWAAPLLDPDEDRARGAVRAFLDWAARRGGLKASGLLADCAAARLLADEAAARGWPSTARREPDRTRGLAFMPQDLHCGVERIAVATAPSALPAALERLLCLDSQAAPRQAIMLKDPLLPALMRAAIRGFGRNGQAAIALTGGGGADAGALVLVAGRRAHLWRLFGPGAADPSVEAALAVAVQRRLALPVVAASTQILAGAGTIATPTQSLSIGCEPTPPAFMARMRVWMGSGLFG